MLFDYQQQPGLSRWNLHPVQEYEPLVSIITPFYNGGACIQQTANCILDQTFPYFEWIIVDDGSTDAESLALLDEIKTADPRIRVFHEENGGTAKARNFGISQAQTPYVLPLDDDDLLEPTFIEYCWWMLEHHSDAAWSYTDSCGFQEREYLWSRTFDPNAMRHENLLTATALIRKSAIEDIGGYYVGQKHCNEDWHLWLRLIAAGHFPVQTQQEYLMWYRRTSSGKLSTVTTNSDISRSDKALISEAASLIEDPHPPIVFPGAYNGDWVQPKLSDWNRQLPRAVASAPGKRIAMLIPWLAMGGADKFNIDFAAGLREKGYDIGILTTVPAEGAWQQRFRAITPEVFCMPNFMHPQDYAEFVSYYLKSRRIDILFLSNSYSGYYLVPWLREYFPELVIVDYVHMEEWYWRRGGYARITGSMGAVTEKTYVCNSSTERVIAKHFGRALESVETVHVGVDADYFDAAKVPAGTIHTELDIADTRPVVLFACRLHPQKRPFLMLEIAARVAERIPDAAFAVVGSGPSEGEMREAVTERQLEDTVFFLGEKADMRPYYRDAALTLVCSLMEGLSLTTYESCSMGVPVVSADVGGQADLVDESVGAIIPCRQPDDTTGFDAREFDEAEIEDYVQAIVRIIGDPHVHADMSAACRERVETAFSIAKMVERFDAEFTRLTTDAALPAQRRVVADTLAALAPLSAELYLTGLEAQGAEGACFVQQPDGYGLLEKAVDTYRIEGIGALVRKTARWFKDRRSRR